MKNNPSSTSKDTPNTTAPQTGYKVWHFALAVPALAVTLQLFLGSLTPLPQDQTHYPTRYASTLPGDYQNNFYHEKYQRKDLPEIEILPLNLRGEMTGPLLASVLQEYFPESTTEHAADLRDTLPPCDNPRMIVILPKDEKPVF